MTEFERPDLYWNGEFHDVLSVGFVPKTDPKEQVHRLSRLFENAWGKGDALVSSTRDYRDVVHGMGQLLVARYKPSWGGESTVEVIARVDARVPSMAFAAGIVLRGPENMEIPELAVGYEPERQSLVGDIEVPTLSLELLGGSGMDAIGYDLARRAGNFYQAVQANA